MNSIAAETLKTISSGIGFKLVDSVTSAIKHLPLMVGANNSTDLSLSA